jgi:hypothetical protein
LLINANYNCRDDQPYCIPTGGACDDAGVCPGTCSTDPTGMKGATCKTDNDCAVGMLCQDPAGHGCDETDGCTCVVTTKGAACKSPEDCTNDFEWNCYNHNGLDDGCGPDGGYSEFCWCQGGG